MQVKDLTTDELKQLIRDTVLEVLAEHLAGLTDSLKESVNFSVSLRLPAPPADESRASKAIALKRTEAQ